MKLLLSALLLSAATAFSPKAQSHVALRTARPSLAPMESIKITVRNGESVDSVIMRLRREVNKSGHLRTLRNKRYHEDAREKKKRKVRLLGPPHPRPRGAPRDPRAPAQIAESRRKMKFARQRKRRAVRPPRLASRPRPAHRGGGAGGRARPSPVRAGADARAARRSSRARKAPSDGPPAPPRGARLRRGAPAPDATLPRSRSGAGAASDEHAPLPASSPGAPSTYTTRRSERGGGSRRHAARASRRPGSAAATTVGFASVLRYLNLRLNQ